MKKGTVCPVKSTEWKLLVESLGSRTEAYAVWYSKDPVTGEPRYEFPEDIIAEAAAIDEDRDTSIDLGGPDIRIIEKKEKLEAAREVVSSRVEKLKRNPTKNEHDYLEIASLESVIDKMVTLDTEYAIEAFIAAAKKMEKLSTSYLEGVKNGTKKRNLKQLYKIREFEYVLDLVIELAPELDNNPDFKDASVDAAALMKARILIKKERLFQQRAELTEQWAPHLTKVDLFHTQTANRQFDVNEKKRYKGKEKIAEERKKYVQQYMEETAGMREAEKEDMAAKMFSEIDDIPGIENYLLNPKDLDNDVIQMAVSYLDRYDWEMEQDNMELAQDIEVLRDAYIKQVGYSHNQMKLYDAILEKDSEGNLTGDYINPHSPGGQHREFQDKYAGTAVHNFYNKVVTEQLERDKGVSQGKRLGYSIPRMNRNNMERATSQGLIEGVSNALTDLTNIKDSTLFGELEDPETAAETLLNKGKKSVVTSESGKVIQFVPIHYRSKTRVPVSDMSFDIASVAVIDAKNVDNFMAKTKAAIILDTLMDVVADGKVNQKEGGNVFINWITGKQALKTGADSNVLKQLDNLMQGRVYGVKIEGDKKIAHVTDQIKRYSSAVGIGVNLWSAGTNYMQGQLASWIETAGGKDDLFSAKNRVNGFIKYDSDVIELVLDTNRNVSKSKTNLLLHMLNQSDAGGALNNPFVKDTIAKKVGGSNLYLLQGITEKAIQGVLMYSMLDNIKVKNKEGKFINKEGNVVENRDQAMSMDEAYTVVDGKLVLHPEAASTEKTADLGRDAQFVVSSLYSRTARDLYGNYNPENRSIFKRTIIGNLVEHMRGWFFTGVLKRYKGGYEIRTMYGDEKLENARFNRETQKLERGTYIELVRFLNHMIMSLKASGIKSATDTWGVMNQQEKARVKKAMLEIGLMISLVLLAKATEDDDDLIYLAFLAKRIQGEFGVYSNVYEMMRMTKSLIISLGVVKDTFDVAFQLANPTEKYKTGRRRGDSRLKKEITDLIPILKQLNKDTKEQYNLLYK